MVWLQKAAVLRQPAFSGFEGFEVYPPPTRILSPPTLPLTLYLTLYLTLAFFSDPPLLACQNVHPQIGWQPQIRHRSVGSAGVS